RGGGRPRSASPVPLQGEEDLMQTMQSRRRFLLPLLWATYGSVAPEAAMGFDGNGDLAIVMAVDASSSIDDHEFELQLQGIAGAFRRPEVLEAIRSGPLGKVDVALLLWAGSAAPSESRWFRIANESDADRFAEHVETL